VYAELKSKLRKARGHLTDDSKSPEAAPPALG
jgi:hypothetical protein